MLENFIVVAQQVLVLFILISLGFVCGKKKIITDVSAKHINNLVLYFVTPVSYTHLDVYKRQVHSRG